MTGTKYRYYKRESFSPVSSFIDLPYTVTTNFLSFFLSCELLAFFPPSFQNHVWLHFFFFFFFHFFFININGWFKFRVDPPTGYVPSLCMGWSPCMQPSSNCFEQGLSCTSGTVGHIWLERVLGNATTTWICCLSWQTQMVWFSKTWMELFVQRVRLIKEKSFTPLRTRCTDHLSVLRTKAVGYLKLKKKGYVLKIKQKTNNGNVNFKSNCSRICV